MVELPELDNDPWSTFPIKKKLLRELMACLEESRKDVTMYHMSFNAVYAALEKIAGQETDSEARQIARNALLW